MHFLLYLLASFLVLSCGEFGGFGVGRIGDPGSPDLTFGTAGRVTFPTGARSEDDLPTGGRAEVQADGKILYAGVREGSGGTDDDFFLARFNADGSSDTSFGSDGKIAVNVGAFDFTMDLAVQADGKALIVGSDGDDIVLLRFTTDGQLDTSFGGDGIATADTHSSEAGLGVTAAAEGKIVVGGFSDADMVVLRFDTAGALDATFSGDGIVTINHGVSDQAWTVAAQPDGKVLVGGTNGFDFALSRLNTDGSLDTSFGTGGSVLTDVESGDRILSLAVDTDGSIVGVGRVTDDSIDSVGIARYKSDGSLDSAFGTDGVQVTTASSDSDLGMKTVIQSDSKILVAVTSNSANFNIVRYLPTGVLDTTFSQDGILTADFEGAAAFASGLALQPDGKFVVSGYVWINSESAYGVGLARFWQ